MAQPNSVLNAAPGVVEGEQRKKRSERPFFSAENPLLWLAPGIGLLLIYSIFPLVYNIYISFHEWKIREKFFEPVGFENWVNLLTNADGRFYNSLLVTIEYVIIALVIQLLLGFAIALMLDARPYGAGFMQSVMILPMVTAPAVAGMMFRLLEHSEFGAISWLTYELGLLSVEEPLLGGTGQYALLALIIVDVWQWTPFFVLIILAGLKGLPHEVLEAAHVDGANFWQRLFRIKIPLLRSIIIIAILFRLIDLYRVFDYVVIITSGGPGGRTESLSFYAYANTFQRVEWGYGAAIALAIVIIAWVTAYVYQKVLKVTW